MDFLEFMKNKKEVNKWFVVMIYIAGAFSGALLATAFIIAFGFQ